MVEIIPKIITRVGLFKKLEKFFIGVYCPTLTDEKGRRAAAQMAHDTLLFIMPDIEEAMSEGILIGKRKQFEETYLQDHGKMPPADQYPTK